VGVDLRPDVFMPDTAANQAALRTARRCARDAARGPSCSAIATCPAS
jgi:hypothetical protein